MQPQRERATSIANDMLASYKLPFKTRMVNMIQNVSYAASFRKPYLLARLAFKTLHGLLLRTPMERQIEIAVDYRCNLNCSHCSSALLLRPDKPLMDLDDFEALAKQTKALGITSYIFTGGEPLSFLDRLEKIIPLFEPSKNLITLQTNGILLTDSVARRLHRMGVDNLFLSLDTFHSKKDEQSIDLEKVSDTIDLIQRNGLRVLFVTVITHGNIKSRMIQEMIDFLTRKRIILFFNIAIPIGAWKNRTDIALNEKDQEYVRHLTLRYPYTRFDFAANFGGFGCPAFKERLYITPYGDILGCPFLQISFGNIRHESLSSARTRAMQSPYFDHYHKLCLAGEDPEFMKFYLPAYNGTDLLPLDEKAIVDKIFSSQPKTKGNL